MDPGPYNQPRAEAGHFTILVTTQGFAHSSLYCKRRLIRTLLQNQILLLDTDFWWEYFRN